jgi:transcription antitermination factor NusA-like protein
VIDFQEQYIKNIEEAQGKRIDVIRKSWGHCPTWSAPEEFVKALIAEASK